MYVPPPMFLEEIGSEFVPGGCVILSPSVIVSYGMYSLVRNIIDISHSWQSYVQSPIVFYHDF